MVKMNCKVRQELYEMCKLYLRGDWAQVKQEDLIIETMADGNINNLFICSLPEDVVTEYKRIIIRYNSGGLEDFKTDTHVLAIHLILSEKNISPKLLAVFSEGTISHFIESRYFNFKDDVNPKYASKLGRTLARFHSLEMPVPKKGTIMFLAESGTPFFERNSKTYLEGNVRNEIIKQNYKTLMNLNFAEEVIWLNDLVDKLNCPLVFSHNDFNKRNILVKESEGSEEVQIFLIDFDWTAYNYRGVDFGQYFSSWGQTEPEFDSGDFPTDEQMSLFIDSYIEEMSEIFGDSYAEQEINSRQQIIKEAKIFSLMAFVKDIMFTIWQTDIGKNMLEKGEIRFKCYKNLKEKILREYSLPINSTIN